MISTSSTRRDALRACALVAVIVAAPTACILDVQGKTGEGSGGSSTTSTASSTSASASSSSSSSTSGGTGGATPGCTVGAITQCYDGPPEAENVGICKSGHHTCQDDGTTYSPCTGEIDPGIEDCFTAADEDCDSKSDACSGTTEKGAGSGGPSNDDVVFAVAADKSGNIVLGGAAGVTASNGGFDLNTGSGVVTKIAKDGTITWSVAMTSSVFNAYSVVRGVAVDANDNVFVVGEVRGATDGPEIKLSTGTDIDVDVFLAKLDPGGKTLWAKAFGDVANQFGNSVALDPAGNVFITGRLSGFVNFGGGAPGVSGVGSDNVFVAKFDTAGGYLWSKAFGDYGSQIGFGAAATPEGDVVIAGQLGGKMTLGGGIAITSAGGYDVFVAKLAGAAGDAMWAHRYGDGSDQFATGVAVGADGGVVITGGIAGKCDFGGGELDAGGHYDAFVAKLKPTGDADWSQSFGSKGQTQVATSVAVDPANNIVFVGYFKETMDFFGKTTLTDTAMNNVNSTDVFVAKLSASGGFGWAHQFGDVADQTLWAVAADSKSHMIAGGTNAGTVNLPPSITTTGGYDAFWVQLAP